MKKEYKIGVSFNDDARKILKEYEKLNLNKKLRHHIPFSMYSHFRKTFTYIQMEKALLSVPVKEKKMLCNLGSWIWIIIFLLVFLSFLIILL